MSRGMSFVWLENTQLWVNLSQVTHVTINSMGHLRLSVGGVAILVTDAEEIEKMRNILATISQ